MDGFLEIKSDRLTARINPFGAELWSLTDADGAQWMTDADPAYWSGHAPVLFPIVGSLAGDAYRLDGETLHLPRHGFARRSAFAVVEQAADRAVLRLTDNAETRAVYPFAFVLELAFRTQGLTLEVTATVANPGAKPLPFSLGFHPAFAWPLPGGADKHAHKLVFAEDEPQPIRRVAAGTGLLLPASECSPVEGRTLPLSEELFRADAVIWDHLHSRSLSYGADGGGWLDVAFPDMPMLGLWQVPGARYICIEPWQGHADPVAFAGDFRDKPGIVELAPGARRSFRMTITLRPSKEPTS